ASAAWWRRRGDRPLPWSWRATCLAAVHGNHIVGSRSQIRGQSSRRRKHVIERQIECSRQCRHQPVRRRILPLALDARQVGNGNVDPPRQFGERHLPLLTLAAKILSEGHALPPDLFDWRESVKEQRLPETLVLYMFSFVRCRIDSSR